MDLEYQLPNFIDLTVCPIYKGVVACYLPMFQEKHTGAERLGVLGPGTGDHPDRVLGPLASDHEEGGPARPPELLVDPEPLPPGAAVGRVEVIKALLEPHLGRGIPAVLRVPGRPAELPVSLARVRNVPIWPRSKGKYFVWELNSNMH